MSLTARYNSRDTAIPILPEQRNRPGVRHTTNMLSEVAKWLLPVNVQVLITSGTHECVNSVRIAGVMYWFSCLTMTSSNISIQHSLIIFREI